MASVWCGRTGQRGSPGARPCFHDATDGFNQMPPWPVLQQGAQGRDGHTEHSSSQQSPPPHPKEASDEGKHNECTEAHGRPRVAPAASVLLSPACSSRST